MSRFQIKQKRQYIKTNTHTILFTIESIICKKLVVQIRFLCRWTAKLNSSSTLIFSKKVLIKNSALSFNSSRSFQSFIQSSWTNLITNPHIKRKYSVVYWWDFANPWIKMSICFFIQHRENGPGWNWTSTFISSRQWRVTIAASSICCKSNIHT